MKLIEWSQLDDLSKKNVLQRPVMKASESLRHGVAQILSAVKERGDAALSEFTASYDKVKLSSFKVTEEEFKQAEAMVTAELSQAIDQAIANITVFHKEQMPDVKSVTTMPGVQCRRETRPIEKVGLYVPGGTAPLLSTVMMLAIPARIAGCQTKILCTPPKPDASIDPHILVAARRCGIDQVFKLGGAQAIAAMAFGTRTVPKVYKIFGPGNSWVTEAKIQVSLAADGAVYDMPAGPSEVLVIADGEADSTFIASDLLSQAEHGVDSQSILVTDSKDLAEKVQKDLEEQLKTLSRSDIARKSLENGAIILCQDIDEAIAISNEYGPEHLIIQCKGAESMTDKVRSAGSVFIGPWTPESVGDYASGTNHVLPTYGYTKNTSGLGVDAFLKQMTIQTLSSQGLRNLGQTVMDLAEVEGLDAHKEAVRLRMNAIYEGDV